MSHLPSLEDINVKGKKILVRVDLNVPMAHDKVTDLTRILRVLPTIKELIKKKARVILLSHFGRPNGEFVRSMSLAPLTNPLSEIIGKELKFGVDCIGSAAKEAADSLKDGDVLLLENLRFHKGEEKNEKTFADALAKIGDVYINDAFSCSHRSHASIVGLAERLPSAAGLLLLEEIENLENLLSTPATPVAAIVGGSKVSTKIELLENLIKKVDLLAIGGGMANTFLLATKKKIGKSMHEKNFVKTAEKIMERAKKSGCEILLPVDAVIADGINEGKSSKVVSIDKVPANKMILDIGPRSVMQLSRKLENYKTIVWNGPLGAFEHKPFDAAGASVARMIALLTSEKKIKSIAGGGDVNACIDSAGLTESFTYISTAGGAFLEWIEGKELPGIAALYKHKKK